MLLHSLITSTLLPGDHLAHMLMENQKNCPSERDWRSLDRGTLVQGTNPQMAILEHFLKASGPACRRWWPCIDGGLVTGDMSHDKVDARKAYCLPVLDETDSASAYGKW